MSKDNTSQPTGKVHSIGISNAAPSTAQQNLDKAIAKRNRKNAKRLEEASKWIQILDA